MTYIWYLYEYIYICILFYGYIYTYIFQVMVQKWIRNYPICPPHS